MPSPLEPPARRAPHHWLVLFVGLASLACAALLVWLARPRSAEPTTVVQGTSSVVAAVQQLARLETVRFHMERVIDIRDKQSHLFGLVQSEDALLLVAAADITAGVDLARVGQHDIEVDPTRRRVHIRLPVPEILSAQLDNEHTYVHARTTDRLAVPARTLETRARQEAERSLRDAALEAGILTRAAENAAQTLRTLLAGLGFDEISVELQTER